ncbi:hypothetical protein NLG97_g8048 [Lecanicillium saksenae]|uniref:Uncharacterized protein n=1 Tax=Lecanicillium saksenae TaxID=468837 RepID=A0ACC1QK47_9HYPO|nr:hypothetical protein NLG97_g8048 [Lecanicillium saksenae]
MKLNSFKIAAVALFSCARAANIPIFPVTNVNQSAGTGYFSDPFHVDYQNATSLYISGTTHSYMECAQGDLSAGCASKHENKYETNAHLNQTAKDAGTTICGAAGIHPFQSDNGSWDALVTLHVQNDTECDGISGWTVIVHAHPEHNNTSVTPPTSWIGDKVIIGSFAENVDANYDGKYFQTPDKKLYIVYQKQNTTTPKRDGVVAWRMTDPVTLSPGTEPRWLLLPDESLNSENYVAGNQKFKLIETGNILTVGDKFVMAYSVGAYNHKTYKVGIAYSDTFLPAPGQQYRKVMKNNPHNLWKSKGDKEVYYLLQSEVTHDGWHYIGNQVLAPGVPTVAQIGPKNSWVLLFAGYDPKDAPFKNGTHKFQANHRRPYFTPIDVKIPDNVSVKQATDAQLQDWITPQHE